MPSPLPTTDFYAHHSPWGAFASFTLGRHGKKGGFGLELSGPAAQDVYVAVSRAGAVRALPFYAVSAQAPSEADAYTGGAGPAPPAATSVWTPFTDAEITRTLGWGTDTWAAGDLTFSVVTPWGSVPDFKNGWTDEHDLALCPAIFVKVTLDNTAYAEEAFAFFGVGDANPLRPLSDLKTGLVGVAGETRWGFAVVGQETYGAGDVRETMSWDIENAVALASSAFAPPLYRLANRGGVLLRVGPRETRTYTLALGFYRGGTVTSGIATEYAYARRWPGLEDVFAFAIQNADALQTVALTRDTELDALPLSDARKFLLAHATHSYHGSTMFLHDESPNGALSGTRSDITATTTPTGKTLRPLWVVNEGEYRMLNTFDLTVDQAFFEIRYHPWTLRNNLDLFTARYRYTDEAQNALDPVRPQTKGGISFTHDMGVANMFSAPGYSSYERTNLDDCFSYMTHEQLCNWVLCAAVYGLPHQKITPWAGDFEWLQARVGVLLECLESLENRDAADAADRNGVMSLDAARCEAGQEITTYDSLDASLGQARANAYLAVKSWAAYHALKQCFEKLNLPAEADRARAQANRAAATVASHYDAATGLLPAVFESNNPGYGSRIIPAIEGLAFPYLLDDDDALDFALSSGPMLTALRAHLEHVLVPGICLDATSGGWKLSSSSVNTWMSKIFLSQFVAEDVLGVPTTPGADDAHAKWQREGDCRDFAFTDQVRSSDGQDLGSRFYPRGVTAILWLVGKE